MTSKKVKLHAKREYADRYIFTGREKERAPSATIGNLLNLAVGVLIVFLIYGLASVLGV